MTSKQENNNGFDSLRTGGADFVCHGAGVSACFGRSGAESLPSWNEGATKRAFVEFVTRVTKEGDAAFVPVSDRIATFDNDGRAGAFRR